MSKQAVGLAAMMMTAALLSTSCLKESPVGILNEKQAFTDAKSLYINAVATLYNYIGGSADSQGLQGTARGVYDYNTFTTDEAIIPIRGGDWYDGGYWENLYLHTWTPDDGELYDTWAYLYKVVMLCNRSLARIESNADLLTETQKAEYTAEVRAVRALFYWYLMDMFGNVPLVKSYPAPEMTDVMQASRSETFRFVTEELREAGALLPRERSNREGAFYGRLTQPVVQFVLAKLALNAEVYADDDWTDGARPEGTQIMFDVDGVQMNAWEACIAYCDMIEEAGYALEADYSTNFSVHNEVSSENIFTIPMDKNLYSNQFLYLFRSRHYNHGNALGMASENGPCATLSTVRAFGYGTDETDSRYGICFYSGTVTVDGKLVLLDDGKPLVYEPLEVKLNLTDSPYMLTAGARMSKYAVDRTAYSDGKLQDNDIVMFRYADVLLMRAEAKVRNGGDGSAELDAVRSRSGMPVRPATLDNILEERLLELVWEGWRRQDMIRFGEFHKSYDQREQLAGEEDGFTTVFPIPAKARELNRALKQNPGYPEG